MLPASRGALVTAILLATGRALGETMAILMVSGNVVQLPARVFDPVCGLAAIALERGYALGYHRSALFVSGLVLMTAMVGLVAVAEHHRLGAMRSRAVAFISQGPSHVDWRDRLATLCVCCPRFFPASPPDAWARGIAVVEQGSRSRVD